jgi:uncharacterized membrane protein YraQ (UPF0718 family)
MSISREAQLQDYRVPAIRLLTGFAIFVLFAAVGLFFVKWSPYWLKVHVAATHHNIGASIVSGKAAQAPAVGWQAALNYAVAYFSSVWKAVALALILGVSVQVFVPRRWLHRLLGRTRSTSVALAGVFSLAGLM